MTHAYDLALREIVDESFDLRGTEGDDVRARIGRAILSAFRNGASDLESLTSAGVEAATWQGSDPGRVMTWSRSGFSKPDEARATQAGPSAR